MSTGTKKTWTSEDSRSSLTRSKKTSSRFWGVCWDCCAARWSAHYLNAEKKLVHVGLFDDEEDAAIAYNEALEREVLAHGVEPLRRKLNLVGPDGRLLPKPGQSSEFYGVSWLEREKKWFASMRLGKRYGGSGEKKKLGLYDDETDAAKAVDSFIRQHMPKAAALLNYPTADERGAAKLPRTARPKAHKRRELSGEEAGPSATKYARGPHCGVCSGCDETSEAAFSVRADGSLYKTCDACRNPAPPPVPQGLDLLAAVSEAAKCSGRGAASNVCTCKLRS